MYKYRFTKWGWHKYNSKSQRSAATTRRPIIRPEGKSRSKFVNIDGSRQSTFRAVRNADRGERVLVYPLLHQNDQARHINIVLKMTQQYIEGEMETGIDFGKTDPNTQRTSLFSDNHGTNMYQTLVSALGAFILNDIVVGGRLLRRAFRILEIDINHMGLIQSVEYCFSIPHLFVAYGRNDLAILLLKYMAPRLRMIPKRHPLVIICEPLLSLLQTPRQLSQDSLERVLGLGIDTFAAVRPWDCRTILHFRSRFSSNTRAEALEEIISSYLDLIQVSLEELSDMDPKVLGIEREVLDFVTRHRFQPVKTMQWCQAVISKIEAHYAKGGIPAQGWREEHQKVWIDIHCLLIESMAFGGDLDQAIKKSRDVYDFVGTTRRSLAPNKWHANHSFQIWLEVMLYAVGKMDEVEEFREVRMGFKQYRLLEKESVAEEQDFMANNVGN